MIKLSLITDESLEDRLKQLLERKEALFRQHKKLSDEANERGLGIATSGIAVGDFTFSAPALNLKFNELDNDIYVSKLLIPMIDREIRLPSKEEFSTIDDYLHEIEIMPTFIATPNKGPMNYRIKSSVNLWGPGAFSENILLFHGSSMNTSDLPLSEDQPAQQYLMRMTQFIKNLEAAFNWQIGHLIKGRGYSKDADQTLLDKTIGPTLFLIQNSASGIMVRYKDLPKISATAKSVNGVPVVTLEVPEPLKEEFKSGWIEIPAKTFYRTVGLLEQGMQKDSQAISKPAAGSLESKLSFEDVAGCLEAKGELETYVDFMKDPAKYLTGGVMPPKGVILHGPPGTGKTLLARVVAAQTGSKFYEIKPEQYMSKWHGETEHLFAEMLRDARNGVSTVLFFDEFDTVVPKAEHLPVDASRRDVVAQLRKFIDGFTEQNNVYIVGATNHLELIDDAIKSRLKPLEVPLPDYTARRQIIKLEMQKSLKYAADQSRAHGISEEQINKIMIYDPDLDLAAVAKKSEGLGGRDIHNINESLKKQRIRKLSTNPTYLITTEDWLNETKYASPRNGKNPMGFTH